MKKIDGFAEAQKLLQHLNLEEQQRLLADIARRDPELALKLKQNLVTFDDLLYLTPQMFALLQRQIKLSDLGLALRGVSPELVQHLTKMLSTRNREELDETLKGKPQPLSKVLEAQQEIMVVVRSLIESGQIVLSKEKSEKMV